MKQQTVSQEWTARRNERARWIRERRTLTHGRGMDGRWVNELLRQNAPRAPLKPTVENLREWARRKNRVVEDGIPRGLPCGADDAYGERLDAYREECFRIWREVGRF